MKRLRILLVIVAACSAKQTTPSTQHELPIATAAAAAPAAPAAATPAALPVMPPPDPREAKLSAAVLDLLEHDHLLGKRIDDQVSRSAFPTYLDALDASKLFLLRSDREALAKYETQIDDELRSGSLDLAHEGQKRFVARVAVVEQMVATLLASPMNHDDEEYVELDPKKLEPAKTDDELRERWRQRLELEVMERVAQMEERLAPDKAKAKAKAKAKPGAEKAKAEEDKVNPISKIPPTPEGREAKARADLAKSYAARFVRLRNPGPLDAASELINAVTSTLDPHTTYLPPADKANFDIQITGSLEGIGAALRERDDFVEVSELVPGGAAWRQGGLAQGDLIVSVEEGGKDPVDIMDMRLDDVVGLIRGKKGTIVRLGVRKPDGHQETVAITRDVIVIEESYARGAVLSRKGEPTFGYIHLPSFYGGPGGGQRKASTDVRRLLAEMKTRKVAGIVLDIRGNGGGLLGDAVELTGELIDHGPVVQVRDHDGKREVLGDEKEGEDFTGPVVVLVDQFSASASEILAGALQDYHRAIIVGTGPTHGKGTVQALANLDRGSAKPELGVLKLTIEQFFRVSGSSTQREGVTPDIVLPNPASYIKSGERDLDHSIAWSQIAPAPHTDWPAAWKAAALAQRSQARVAKNPLLAKIATATEVLRARRDDTRVPLQRSAWDQRRKQQKAELEAAAPDLEHAPAKVGVVTIEDPSAPVTAPAADGKADDRPQRWRDALARDPWVEESLNIVHDMAP